MNAPHVIAHSRGLRLECLDDSNNAIYAIRVEPERDIGIIQWLLFLVMAFCTCGFAVVTIWPLRSVLVSDLGGAIAWFLCLGFMTYLCGAATYIGFRDAVCLWYGQVIGINTQAGTLTLQHGPWFQRIIRLSDVKEVRMQFGWGRSSEHVWLMISLRRSADDLLIQSSRWLGKYQRGRSLAEISVVGQAIAAILKVPFQNKT